VVCSILTTFRDKSLILRVTLPLLASYGKGSERKSLKVRNNAQTRRCESL
jgi:hypothetical protein